MPNATVGAHSPLLPERRRFTLEAALKDVLLAERHKLTSGRLTQAAG